MVGVVLGILCGCVEFGLLKRLVDGVTGGSVPLWVIPCKLFALALFFLPCAWLAPAQLSLCGIAAAAVLLLAAAGLFLWRGHTNKTPGNGSDPQ